MIKTSIQHVKKRGLVSIGLEQPKTSANVGSILRAAANYQVALVAITGRRYENSRTDTVKQWRHTPLINVPDLHSAIPYRSVPVAVDLVPEAIPLTSYQHPKRAFYVFGAEDNTLGTRITGWCRDVVYIPTHLCTNLAAAVHIVLYDRLSKEGHSFDTYPYGRTQ